MKLIDFVGYAQNPGNLRRNQTSTQAGKSSLCQDEPKFRSEQERESLTARTRTTSGNDSDVMNSSGVVEAGSEFIVPLKGGPGSLIPRFYRRVEIKYSKFGIEDFDFGFYNKTLYGGLETDIANSYCNSILQMLYSCKPICELAKLMLRLNNEELVVEEVLSQTDEIPETENGTDRMKCAFYKLTEELEIRSDGTRSVIKPSRLGLARVSVIRGIGSGSGMPFIDDYINSSEPIVDYLTEFSGIKVGDLDPNVSTKPLVPLKAAYKKLRLLVDLGCIFVGHGLKKDFRIINILVPSAQVVDTVDLFWIKERQRVLRSDIQRDTHDSVEDARTALALYKKYIEYKEQGIFDEILERVYEEGRAYNFKPPQNPHNPQTPNNNSAIQPGKLALAQFPLYRP
ncbi:poly(A)-specific ribonuclease [Phlyctochytrium bullatum]|nr:poly(A)-specific ribonuclease [Phlyctochytrium bullatum]